MNSSHFCYKFGDTIAEVQQNEQLKIVASFRQELGYI